MNEDIQTLRGHLPGAVNAYNAPRVPGELQPLPVPEDAGQGVADLPVPGKTYRATYSTDWPGGGRGVCMDTVSAEGPWEAVAVFRRDHGERCGEPPTE